MVIPICMLLRNMIREKWINGSLTFEERSQSTISSLGGKRKEETEISLEVNNRGAVTYDSIL